MNLQELSRKIEESFNLSELKDLCFDLNLNFEDLSGDNRKDKIRELVLHCDRHSRLAELVALCKELRPGDTWDIGPQSVANRLQSPKYLGRWLAGCLLSSVIGLGLVALGIVFWTLESEDSTEPTRSAEILPTDIPLESSPLPAMTPEPAAAEPVELVQSEWDELIAFSVTSSGPALCQGLVFPPQVDPNLDVTGAIVYAQEALANDLDTWDWAPRPNFNSFSFDLSVTSQVQNGTWLMLENSMDVSISSTSSAPENVNVLHGWGCGGGGSYRILSDVSLMSDFSEYEVEASAEESDFYTLQPNEFEIFRLPVQCQAPGVYKLSFQLPFSGIETDGAVDYAYERRLICPAAYTIWYTDFSNDSAFLEVERYIWNGSDGYLFVTE